MKKKRQDPKTCEHKKSTAYAGEWIREEKHKHVWMDHMICEECGTAFGRDDRSKNFRSASDQR